MDMTREIRIEEGKLKVVFEIQENGVVELKQFDSAGRMDVKGKRSWGRRFLSDYRSSDHRTWNQRDACI